MARSFRSATRGLAQVDAPRGTLIAYATEPGGVAADGVGGNSPYTLALAANMRRPGRAAEEVFRQVRIEVLAATDQQQTPWESSSLTGAFYFNEGDRDATLEVASLDPAASPAAPLPVVPAAPALRQERDAAADPRIAEVAFWQSIAHADDPAPFEAYLRKYPEGEFRELAAWRRDQFGGRLPASPCRNPAVAFLPFCPPPSQTTTLSNLTLAIAFAAVSAICGRCSSSSSWR
ncbi:MAG: hypothetical protein HC871_16685 [Rhizobiales bacterium]|nr:hypothetical protein [Hyphomicrobiales bacterium]